MGAKHTLGPWRAEHKPSLMWHVYGSDHASVCFTAATVYAKSRDRRAADARLIASAPDLLEACRAGLYVAEAEGANATAALIRDAIRKATGEAS